MRQITMPLLYLFLGAALLIGTAWPLNAWAQIEIRPRAGSGNVEYPARAGDPSKNQPGVLERQRLDSGERSPFCPECQGGDPSPGQPLVAPPEPGPIPTPQNFK